MPYRLATPHQACALIAARADVKPPSGQRMSPAMRVRRLAPLDRGQPRQQPRRHRPCAAIANLKVIARSGHAPDRGHHRRSAAGERFRARATRRVRAQAGERQCPHDFRLCRRCGCSRRVLVRRSVRRASEVSNAKPLSVSRV